MGGPTPSARFLRNVQFSYSELMDSMGRASFELGFVKTQPWKSSRLGAHFYGRANPPIKTPFNREPMDQTMFPPLQNAGKTTILWGVRPRMRRKIAKTKKCLEKKKYHTFSNYLGDGFLGP